MRSRLRLAAVQMKFAPTIEGNADKIEAAVVLAADRKVDAVLFPECAVTGYGYDFRRFRPQESAALLLTYSSLARATGVNLLLGMPVFVGRKLYNCLVVYGRKGRIVHAYAKCQLTPQDRRVFTPGNAVSLFKIDGVPATAIICHERRYPELVRLGVMAGARILFHPNAGLDSLAVSKTKRGGRDGIDARAFENAIYYVFANSVGPQGRGRWSAGDTKIIGPDRAPLALADNRNDSLVFADVDLSRATGRYAAESLDHPRFLSGHWKRMLGEVRKRNAAWMRHFRRTYSSIV